MVELIAYDKNEKLQYEGYCKLTIDPFSNILLVEPKNEDYKLISALFKWEYIAENFEAKQGIRVQGCPATDYEAENKVENADESVAQERVKHRRRYQKRIETSPIYNSPLKKLIKEPNFEIISFEHKGIPKSHLFIFPSPDKKLCYEYYFNTKRQVYICSGCEYRRKGTIAKLRKNLHGKKIIQLASTNHICQKREFKREKYFKEIVGFPNFEFVCYMRGGKRRTKLLIFPDSKDKTKCYEYFWNCSNKLYTCCECIMLEATYTSARHVKTSEKEFIELLSIQHVCTIRKYAPEKYAFDSSKQIIKSPNFEVFNYKQFGSSKSTLIIFLSEDKQLCHEYYFDNSANKYFCNGCKCFNKEIKAVIKKNENGGEEYVTINKADHRCKPRKYDPEKFATDIILQKPMYEIIEEKVMGKPSKKLLIFTSKEQKFCYKFKFENPFFSCIKCYTKGKYLRARICNDENGKECYVEVQDKKHLCEPIEYLAVENDGKKYIKKPNYQIIERYNDKSDAKTKKLIVFDEKNKNLYYEYLWTFRRKNSGFFRCFRCRPFNINVQANLLHDNEHGEYIELGKNLHKCQPKQYTSDGLSLKIINLPDFEERTVINHDGSEKKMLIVFDSNDKSLCYTYYYSNSYKYYVCPACNFLNKRVTAKLFTNESGQSYLKVSTTKQHVCKPKKYEPQGFSGKIINASNFVQKYYFNKANVKTSRLTVYCNDEKTLYYEYSFNRSAKKYLCEKCIKMKKNTFAKLKKNDAGEEFIELGPRNHFCEPMKKHR